MKGIDNHWNRKSRESPLSVLDISFLSNSDDSFLRFQSRISPFSREYIYHFFQTLIVPSLVGKTRINPFNPGHLFSISDVSSSNPEIAPLPVILQDFVIASRDISPIEWTERQKSAYFQASGFFWYHFFLNLVNLPGGVGLTIFAARDHNPIWRRYRESIVCPGQLMVRGIRQLRQSATEDDRERVWECVSSGRRPSAHKNEWRGYICLGDGKDQREMFVVASISQLNFANQAALPFQLRWAGQNHLRSESPIGAHTAPSHSGGGRARKIHLWSGTTCCHVRFLSPRGKKKETTSKNSIEMSV